MLRRSQLQTREQEALMSTISIVFQEMRQRPLALITCLLAISLGVAAVVAIRSVTVHSERAVARKLEALGANVLLLPRSVTLRDYYASDMHGMTLPEEHAVELALANLEGVEKIAPKLCVATEIEGRTLTLTGILPQSEFQAKAAWQSVSLFSKKHVGCKKACVTEDDGSLDGLASRRYVQQLAEDEMILGADTAGIIQARPGDNLRISDNDFRVAAVLPATGTIDDSRLFAHLHTVQRIAKLGEVVNVIEVMGCCEDAAGKLIGDLEKMFPDAKVVTIASVVQTQVGVNRLMGSISYVLLIVLVLIGGIGIASTMYGNVSDRRREIGTLMALGATPGFVSRLILGKAAVIGCLGGFCGYALGTVLAVVAGPIWLDVAIGPIPSLSLVSLLSSLLVVLVASYLPARRAANLDPCVCFREV